MGHKPRTIGDFIRECIAIDNETDAQAFFEREVASIQAQIDTGTWESHIDATTGARMNIGWCFGEGMKPERIAMWTRVCQAAHPVFGSAIPSMADAIKLGMQYAKKAVR